MSTLAEILSSKSRAEVFRLLFGMGSPEYHVREIGRLSGLNEATVRQELRKLTRLGLLEMRRAGNRAYYRADVSHPLHVDIRRLVLKTAGLVEVLREPLTGKEIQFAFVFGSIARGTEGAASDVDLFVIGQVSLRQLSRLLMEVSATLGREINPHVMTVAEFVRRREAADHFLATVLGEPKLFVIGDEDELVSMGR